MTSDAEHEMYGRMPVWRLFLKCSIPGMISGLVWAFCSIMDGIFVGNYLGSDALAAVNLAWPIMTVFMAVSDMVAAGSSVRISMHLGNGDTDMARRVFTGSVKLIVAISVGFLLIGVFLGGPIVTFMGAEGEVADMAAQYIAVFSLLFFATDNYLRICGAVNLSMWINVGVAVLNVALLAVLIGWLGCGTWASAFATSFSVALGSVVALVPFLRRRFVLRFVGGWMDADTTRRVLYNGTSTAMQPAISYNHGSGDGRRVRSLFVVMSVASAVMGVAVAALCILANEQLTRLFLGDGSVDVAAMASGGLTVFALTYLLSWVAVNVNQTLAATDLPAHALSIGVMSQLLLPTAFLIPMSSMGVDGIWWSMVVASVCSAAFSAAMLCLGARKGIFRMHGPVDTGPLTG